MKILQTVFVDLDGVMFDFNKHVNELTGLTAADLADPDTGSANRKKMWAAVKSEMDAGRTFFGALDLMPGSLDLWNFVVKHAKTVHVLSATGHIYPVRVAQDKRASVNRHFGPVAARSAIFVESSKQKAFMALPDHILIDDRSKSIDPWRAAGGIGVFHTSAEDSIRQLKELLK